MNYMLGNYFHNLYPRGYDSNISIINIERIYGDKLKDCNGKLITEYDYLVVAHEHEVSDFHIFEDLYKWITKFSLPTDKIILVMGDDSLETEYDRYCKINSIDNKPVETKLGDSTDWDQLSRDNTNSSGHPADWSDCVNCGSMDLHLDEQCPDCGRQA